MNCVFVCVLFCYNGTEKLQWQYRQFLGLLVWDFYFLFEACVLGVGKKDALKLWISAHLKALGYCSSVVGFLCPLPFEGKGNSLVSDLYFVSFT